MNTAERLRVTEPTTPLYRRAVPRFQELLRASPTRVIPAMDFSGDDIPYQLRAGERRRPPLKARASCARACATSSSIRHGSARRAKCSCATA